MLNQKSRSNLRIILSCIAFIFFVAYTLCDLFVFSRYSSFITYGFREDLLNYIILSVPFIVLFAFSIMERILKHISGRVYVVGIFALYLVQFLMATFADNIFYYPVFCNKELNSWTELVSFMVGLRLFMLVLVPIANRILLKIYSLVSIAFFSFVLLGAVFYDGYVQAFLPQVISSLVVEIIFHVTLYYFSDLMTTKNESDKWFDFLGVLSFPIFGNPFREDEEETD